jgi:hypothetical protein
MHWIAVQPKTRHKAIGLPARTQRHVDTTLNKRNFNNTFASLCDTDKTRLANLISQLARLERENEELQAMKKDFITQQKTTGLMIISNI